MAAAPAAMPPKPNMAATIEMIKKVKIHRNIIFLFGLLNHIRKVCQRLKIVFLSYFE